MTVDWIIWILLTVINSICAFLYVWRPRRHQHVYDDWSEWILDVVKFWNGQVRAVRYRTCRGCSHVEQQEAGQHQCLKVQQRKDCPHMTHLTGNEKARVKKLERELGL